MTKTVVSHFYNEEYLLPWWLKHHSKIFDHGIMIDYNSTDNSVAIIKELCPTWDIVTTNTSYFESSTIDREVEEYEATLNGWRMCLNTTEFLYGNIARLDDITGPTQLFVGNYVLLDMNNKQVFNKELPLHEQCEYGYYENRDVTQILHTGARSSRSLHNYPIKYEEKGGRHWHQTPNVDDIAIFYFGYASLTPEMIDRKMQIKSKMNPEEIAKYSMHPNTLSSKQFTDNIDLYHRPRARVLTEEIKTIIGYNY